MKRWATDDLVYNTDLNDMVAGGNLVFASVAARDAFLIGDLAPVAGMTVYMQNDSITYKRIDVGGIGYWAPTPGTLMACMVTSSGSTVDQVLSPDGAAAVAYKTPANYGRNLNNCFSTTTYRFTPGVPGFYEMEGLANFYHGTVDGYRATWLCLNGASQAAIPGSWNHAFPGGSTTNTQFGIFTRTVCCYLGATDYVTHMAMHNSTGQTYLRGRSDTSSAGYQYNYDSCFTAKYLGL